MLADNDVIATAAVKDIEAARRFYGETLALKQVETKEEEVLTYKSGRGLLLVYTPDYAGTNKATTATWAVDDVEALARELKSRGVRFEHYDIPGTQRQGDVYSRESWRGAWFTDPDGNIFHIVSR